MINRICNKIKRIIYGILPKKDIIVFESAPDLSDNTKSVFDEMIKRGLNKKYLFVWWVSDKEKKFPKYSNTIYIDNKNSKEFNYYVRRAKVLIFCNQFLSAYYKGQISFYLTHGTALKNVGCYRIPSEINYNLVASEESIPSMAKAFKAKEETFYGLGFPRNDELTNYKFNLQNMFDVKFKKIVVWYPTFRQHKNGITTTSSTIPILDDFKKAKELNNYAKKKDVLIVIKPHFAQDISYITKYELSNVVFINDEFFVKNKISSYQFVGNCDALITDYSSIYFDYLLCDKPIAAVWEDIEEYKKNPGFCIDVDYYMKGAFKIYDLANLLKFIDDVSMGKDILKKEREEICKYANYSKDGKNSERVVDFIIEKGNL